MAFYNKLNNFNNFVISFGTNPRNDFGIFAYGYACAASKLAEELMSRGYRFRDYEAYPIVFLYRHALELYLKNIIYKSGLLAAFKNMENIDSKLDNRHDLNILSEKATKILKILFPNDHGLELALDKILQISHEFSEIDPNSYSYRYPIDRKGNASTKHHQVVNLESLYKTMTILLEDLDAIDLGIGIETDKAQKLYEILNDL